MEWQAVVLAIQILLLAAGWILFQRARGELSAQAAEAPVLAEVKALQQRVKSLLVELESATDRQAARLESGCADAVAVLTEIESKIQIVEELIVQSDRAARRLEQQPQLEERAQAQTDDGRSPVDELQGVVVNSRLLTTASQGIETATTNITSIAKIIPVTRRSTLLPIADTAPLKSRIRCAFPRVKWKSCWACAAGDSVRIAKMQSEK
jgi:hypothetical protein